ncbi:unnamed protein product, partial [Closterium sp. Naga37s-1]
IPCSPLGTTHGISRHRTALPSIAATPPFTFTSPFSSSCTPLPPPFDVSSLSHPLQILYAILCFTACLFLQGVYK